MKYLLNKQEQYLEFNYNQLFASTYKIKNDFCKIWNKIIKKINTDTIIGEDRSEIKNLVLYDILDGSRSTILSKFNIDYGLETVLYTLNFIHILKALGAKTCLIMIHTSYNRSRGEKEFKNILQRIEIGAPFIKRYAIENNIYCSCLCMDNNYELIELLKDVTESTRNGDFCVHFLFNYNEGWAISKDGENILRHLPDIDVHIRHTKFQISGGWIPEKMTRSVFLYSQNGTIHSNWNSDELVALIAIGLLAKLLHKGEILEKTYTTRDEINKRYELRELNLFNKVIYLRDNPKKLFMIGSPMGVYQFYY